MKYRNKHNPRLVVEIIDDAAEIRTGEIREAAVAFRKPGGRLTIRRKAEFLRMFERSE